MEELAAFIGNDLKPDVVCFSNALLCGVLRRLKQQFSGPVFCTLQGDDIFLDSLPDGVDSAGDLCGREAATYRNLEFVRSCLAPA